MFDQDDPALNAKAEDVVTALREAGVYEDHWQWLPSFGDADSGVGTLVMEMYLGDVAFSPRVQNPDQHGVDAEFREIAAQFNAERVKDIIKELKSNT